MQNDRQTAPAPSKAIMIQKEVQNTNYAEHKPGVISRLHTLFTPPQSVNSSTDQTSILQAKKQACFEIDDQKDDVSDEQ